MKDHIFCVDALAQRAADLNAAHLERAHRQTLGGQHVANLRGADAEGHRAKGTMRRGVAIAAGNRHPRLGQALLGANDMDYALAVVVDVEERDCEFGRVLLDRVHHLFRQIVDKGPRGNVGGHDVIYGGESALGEANGEPALSEHLEGLGTGDLVDQMQPDKELRLPRGQLAHRMLVPDLVQ